MNKMYGLTRLQIKMFSRNLGMEDKVNEFLREYDGNIVDIQRHEEGIMIVYVAWEEE